ncbi:EAL domain-containing protein [Cognatiluteimonas telluris]|uniref:EAL domain-containing protein n=1 Tax=Cognatiluteimonas telluris TaxID=1104775 RepID=UPI00140AA467|nr:EAL domain-containing protein [Lysobacter telluris]
MTSSLLSATASDSQAEVGARVRAEFPPPHYWRRWTADASGADPIAPSTRTDDPVTAPKRHPAPDAAMHGMPGDPAPAQGDEPPYRVLVVEDDPSQALFAESVLRGAGIQTHGVRVSGEVMAAMADFQPDLVLMDLHMPGISGTELTAMIRAHQDYALTPIVFLTGDNDPEKQFEALESGADDFLGKPIRPRHLMAAVYSRVKRARLLHRQRGADAARHPVSGLYHRAHVLQSIAAAIAAQASGAALFVEIQAANLLRERYGYAGFEQLMNDAGRRLAQAAGHHPCARLNDNAFLVFAAGAGADARPPLATRLRDGLRQLPFELGGTPQHLDAALGHGEVLDASDPVDLLDALEQAARQARTEPARIAARVPRSLPSDSQVQLADALRAALQDGGLELAFQPVVAVAGGEEAQFQALLRMHADDGSLHRAGALVPAAEAAGLMPDVDRWVLEQALDLMRRRREEGRPLRLFVSQSPRTLSRDLHAPWLVDLLARLELPGPSLVIDLRLEDALLHSVTLRHFSEQVLAAGVQLCLSQYAHGPDADALLEQLSLGYLRLSPRYSDAHADPALRDELRGVIDRAHRLGLQVIGPQVEHAQSAAMLWMSGIDLIQGNLVQQADDALDFDFQHAVL